MLSEIEASEMLMIVDIIIKVFDKDKGKLIIKKYYNDLELAKHDFEKYVNIYHNMDGRYTISLYDENKHANIDYYDSDDNI